MNPLTVFALIYGMVILPGFGIKSPPVSKHEEPYPNPVSDSHSRPAIYWPIDREPP